MPVGGRFEELSWLQCKHVEALGAAAQLARWCGQPDDAERWETRRRHISARIRAVFWRDGVGYIHTLNHVGDVDNPHVPGWGGHYERTYLQSIRLGESGPSRQCNALAVLAGVATEAQRRVLLDRVFRSDDLEPVITPYFLYFEQTARAACGDSSGAVATMSQYVADMLEDRDAATVIEMHDPRVRDHRRFCNHFDVNWDWPLSYCHGWGSGLIPLTQRHLMGLHPTAPGWARLTLEASARLPMDYEASVATPFGPIHVSFDTASDTTRFRVPGGIELSGGPASGCVVERV